MGGLPAGFALTGAKADERQTLLGILAADPALAADRPGQTLIADKHYHGTEFEATLAAQQLRLLRPARKGEHERAGAHLFKPLRQTIESINQTFKSQLDLERHGGHTPAGVMVRVLQRILALTADRAAIIRLVGAALMDKTMKGPKPAATHGATTSWPR